MAEANSSNPWASACSQNTNHLIQMAKEKHVSLMQKREHRVKEPKSIQTKPKKKRDYLTFNYKSEGDKDDTLSKMIQRNQESCRRRQRIKSVMKEKQMSCELQRIQEEQAKIKEEKMLQRQYLLSIKEAYEKKKREDRRAWERLQEYQKQCKMADQFHKKMLLKKYFSILRNFVNRTKENMKLSDEHYKLNMMRKSFERIKIFCKAQEKYREMKAEEHAVRKILRPAFECWRKEVLKRNFQFQVAVEHNSMGLKRKWFAVWKRRTEDGIHEQRHRLFNAGEFYKRALMRRTFCQWRYYSSERLQRHLNAGQLDRLRDAARRAVPDFCQPDDSD